jgi:hypothetical protein
MEPTFTWRTRALAAALIAALCISLTMLMPVAYYKVADSWQGASPAALAALQAAASPQVADAPAEVAAARPAEASVLLRDGPGPALGLPDPEWAAWAPFTIAAAERAGGGGGDGRARKAGQVAKAVPQAPQVAPQVPAVPQAAASTAVPAAVTVTAPQAGGGVRHRAGAAVRLPPGVTEEELLRAAARISPDVFDDLPPAFLPDFKAPCWRREGGELRCLPYVYVLGVFQCGVRDLFHRMLLHPEMTGTANAAPHFWDEIHPWERVRRRRWACAGGRRQRARR